MGSSWAKIWICFAAAAFLGATFLSFLVKKTKLQMQILFLVLPSHPGGGNKIACSRGWQLEDAQGHTLNLIPAGLPELLLLEQSVELCWRPFPEDWAKRDLGNPLQVLVHLSLLRHRGRGGAAPCTVGILPAAASAHTLPCSFSITSVLLWWAFCCNCWQPEHGFPSDLNWCFGSKFCPVALPEGVYKPGRQRALFWESEKVLTRLTVQCRYFCI